MLRFCLSFVLLFGSLVVAGAAPNLRVMPPAELAANSVIVARVRVVAVDESEWADFRQMATLELEDVIEGDFTLRQVKVAARSLLAYTDDHYEKKQEWLVFLWHDAGFYRTVNFQYGQFRIENEVVRGWRNNDNVASDKPYYSVREEVERLLTDLRTPGATDAGAPQPAAPPVAPQPQAGQPQPGQPRPVRRPQVVRPERP
jgi:hypothetical protein